MKSRIVQINGPGGERYHDVPCPRCGLHKLISLEEWKRGKAGRDWLKNHDCDPVAGKRRERAANAAMAKFCKVTRKRKTR